MRKSIFVLCLAFIAIAIAALAALSRYKVDLVHYAVKQAVLQKALPELPRDEIELRFEAARRQPHSDQYLNRLLEISQRIEKLQSIDGKEMAWIYQKLEN